MIFISYAQNFEYVILWRALSHVERGFYIDIGAAWPNDDSVTKGFYDNGWRGVNVEPNPELHSQLEKYRPEDLNLLLAVGEVVEVREMNFLGNAGLSTLDDRIAEQHQREGRSLDRQRVRITTLSRIWDEHVEPTQPVHFLKVDVEGLEAEVLRGNDWSRNRPWIVVVEATLPMSQIECHQEWESILINADYSFAYADGLNRYYVAQEQRALLPAFKYPPNVFDKFKLHRHQQAEDELRQAEERVRQLEESLQAALEIGQSVKEGMHRAEQRAQQAEEAIHQSKEEVRKVEFAYNQVLMELQAVYASKSWRYTTILRSANYRLRHVGQLGLMKWVKTVIKRVLLRVMAMISNKPRIKRLAVSWAQRLGLADRLRNIYQGESILGDSIIVERHVLQELGAMSSRARDIYYQLKKAMEDKKDMH